MKYRSVANGNELKVHCEGNHLQLTDKYISMILGVFCDEIFLTLIKRKWKVKIQESFLYPF